MMEVPNLYPQSSTHPHGMGHGHRFGIPRYQATETIHKKWIFVVCIKSREQYEPNRWLKPWSTLFHNKIIYVPIIFSLFWLNTHKVKRFLIQQRTRAQLWRQTWQLFTLDSLNTGMPHTIRVSVFVLTWSKVFVVIDYQDSYTFSYICFHEI